ncbi:MAG: hypothetical protein QNK15_06685 [Cycloclasticus sp.]|nr:hypothetical protein [Cycloclasticus sp.]
MINEKTKVLFVAHQQHGVFRKRVNRNTFADSINNKQASVHDCHVDKPPDARTVVTAFITEKTINLSVSST